MNTGKRVIDLSLIPNNINPRIYVSQYDVGVTLTFNWSGTLAAGGAARVMGTKPSGIGFDLACTRVGSGTNVTGFTVETTLDMTSEAGEFPAEIRITEGTQVVGSQNFTLVVERSPHPDGTIDGYEEGRTIIETVTGLVNDAEESASEAATSATAAAQSATAAAQSATSAAADAASADASAARAMATTPEGYEEFVTELLANQNGGWARKNLLKNTANSTGNFTVNSDGTITVNGSFSSQTNLNVGTIKFDEDTRVILNGVPAGGGTSSYVLFISGKGTDSGSGVEFTLNAGVTYTVVLRMYAGYTANNLIVKPMLRPATIEDGTYVPYSYSNVDLTKNFADELTANQNSGYVRKNLLKNTTGSATQNGITFTVNDDDTVVANGTNSGNAFVRYIDTNATDWSGQSLILTGCPSSGSTSTYALRVYEAGSGKGYDTGSGLAFTGASNNRIGIFVAAGATLNNVTFKPMVRPATIEDGTYVPYAPSNVDLANTSVSAIKTGATVRKNNKTVWLSLVNLAVTATTMLNVPADYRPLDRVSFLGNWKNTSNQYEAVLITVWSSGDVVAFSPTLNANISNGTLTASGVWLTS